MPKIARPFSSQMTPSPSIGTDDTHSLRTASTMRGKRLVQSTPRRIYRDNPAGRIWRFTYDEHPGFAWHWDIRSDGLRQEWGHALPARSDGAVPQHAGHAAARLGNGQISPLRGLHDAKDLNGHSDCGKFQAFICSMPERLSSARIVAPTHEAFMEEHS